MAKPAIKKHYTMKTSEEIQAEIKALNECLNYAPSHSLFGEDNHAKINLQIEELKTGIDDTSEEWDDYTLDEQDAIMEAREWSEGNIEESPSKGWEVFKK